MPKPTPDLDPSLCACGRDVAEAASVSYRATSGRYLFRRCDCGAECSAGKRPTQQWRNNLFIPIFRARIE